jgi:hypothetical protein
MNDDIKTPDWLMNHFKEHFDPCPLNSKCDGLEINWSDPSFVNPPYSNPLAWVKKAIEESHKGVDVVLLLRVDTSTEWYKLLMEENPHIAFFNERIKFVGNGSPNFCSMLVFLEGKESHYHGGTVGK